MLKWEKDRAIIIPKALKDFDLPKNKEAMEKIGGIAAMLLHKRITREGVDGYGVKLPPLKETGWFFTAPHDERFKGKLTEIGRNPKAKKKRSFIDRALGLNKSRRPFQRALVFEKGYKALKRAMGSKGKRGHSLTGAMWKNLFPVLKKRDPWGWDIVMQFRKTQKVGKKATGQFKQYKKPKKVKVLKWANQYGKGFETITVTEAPKLKTISIHNRVKAREMMRVGNKWAFSLLSWNKKEMQLLMDIWLKLIKKKNPDLLGK